MKLKCFFLGHSEDINFHDCGNPICTRCASHSYYDQKEWEWTLPAIWYKLKWWLTKPVLKCSDCGKTKEVIGISIGDHEHCLPF